MAESNVLRSGAGDPGTAEILGRPARDLLGVSEAAALTLEDLGIRTIFDLGASDLFAGASEVAAASTASRPTRFMGRIAGDFLHDGDAGAAPPDDLGDLPLNQLRRLSAAEAATIESTLDVATIADLAGWLPYREAKRQLRKVAGGVADLEDDSAEDLRPRFGEFPTERVYYSTLVMLDTLGEDGTLNELTEQISLDPAVDEPLGLNRPAIGALLSFQQSWYAQGVTLGHLLHSLSLAPGEATRIAMQSWRRTSTASATEVIDESEHLDSAANHARALSEVQHAVANDFQAGGSASSSTATSTSDSWAESGSSGLIASLGSSGSSSDTGQSATTSAQAVSSSWSLGNRSVLGELTQDVNDRTEQHSSSVRNRRATAVREVSQSEHEDVSTRIVANYNHMHALNLQYYEVVQVYRTAARLHRADRCLFVPIQLLDFSGERGLSVIERFRGALMSAALNDRVRSLLADDTTAVEISPTKRLYFPGVRPDLVTGVLPTRAAFRAAVVSPRHSGVGVEDVGIVDRAAPDAHDPPSEATTTADARVRLWDAEAVARVARFIDRAPVRPGSSSLFVPDDTELIGITFDGLSISTVRLDQVVDSGQSFTVPTDGRIDIVPGVRLVELDAISLTKVADPAAKGSMTLHCSYLGRRFTLPAIPLDLASGTTPLEVVSFQTDQADRRAELQRKLQDDRQHYSQAVFRSLDAATLTFLLGRYSLGGKPLIDQVEPRPVAIAGNYLVLRAPVELGEDSGVRRSGDSVAWGELLSTRGLDKAREIDTRLIPIPTGGVFAEAVLGRSNSAEKLDLTRFWHWQDSPVPLQPPEIAPLQTGSRATPEDLTPSQLGPAVLNIANPTSLPDPSGMSAVLNALAAMNFRDMSGLSGTQKLVESAAEGTLDAATAAGKLASENLRTEAQKAVQMGQIAADIAKAAIAADVAKAQAKSASKGGGGGGVDGISREGALANEGQKLDQADAARGSGSASNLGDGGEADDSSPSGGVSAPSHRAEVFKSAVHGSLGATVVEAVSDIATKTGGGTRAGGAVGANAPLMSPFPGRLPGTLTQDAKLDSAFTAALAQVTADPVFAGLDDVRDLPIAIVALNADGSRPHVGQHLEDMHYSGSMPKFAAGYAAFQLRDAVNELGTKIKPANEDDFFKQVAETFDPQFLKAAPLIGNRVGLISENHVDEDLRLPKYKRIFIASEDSGQYSVDLRIDSGNPEGNFLGILKDMLIHSHAEDAGPTIRTLGYSCINGILGEGGFFDSTTKRGIWLAGDYERAPVVLIPSENDGMVKQVTNVLQTARWWTLLHDGKLFKNAGSPGITGETELMMMFAKAVTGDAPSILGSHPTPKTFTVTHCKIGVGTLKDVGGIRSSCNLDANGRTRRCVLSEASIVEQIAAPKRTYVVCWQNVVDATNRGDADIRRINRILDLVMAAYNP